MTADCIAMQISQIKSAAASKMPNKLNLRRVSVARRLSVARANSRVTNPRPFRLRTQVSIVPSLMISDLRFVNISVGLKEISFYELARSNIQYYLVQERGAIKEKEFIKKVEEYKAAKEGFTSAFQGLAVAEPKVCHQTKTVIRKCAITSIASSSAESQVFCNTPSFCHISCILYVSLSVSLNNFSL